MIIGEEILIGKYSDLSLFMPAALAVLANFMSWNFDDEKVYVPNHNFILDMYPYSSSSTTFYLRISNGQTSVSVNMSDGWKNRLAYWNILKTTSGVIAIGINTYNTGDDGMSVHYQSTLPVVFATNSAGIWNCIAADSGNVGVSTYNETYLFDDNVASKWLLHPKPDVYTASNCMSIAKLPDPLHGGVFNGLYKPIYTERAAYWGVYSLQGKRFHNLTRSEFSIIAALD